MGTPIKIDVVLRYGEITEIADEGKYGEKTSIKILWKIAEISGRSETSFQELVRRIRHFSSRIFEGILAPEKEIRAVLEKSGKFCIKIFLSAAADLPATVTHIHRLSFDNYFEVISQKKFESNKCFIGEVPMPAPAYQKALKAEAIVEILGTDQWTFERCFLSKDDQQMLQMQSTEQEKRK